MDGAEEHEIATTCANCSKEESKMLCKGCRLVKYCSKDCQIAHRHQHKKACRKRAAELRDEALFKQPPKGDDCPICFQLLPVLGSGQTFMSCCGKVICGGCVFADFKQNHRQICPFCRTPVAENMTDVIQRHNKWLEVNDPYAFFDIGTRYFQGLGVVQDKSKALEYYLRGVELGSADCLAIVGFMYDEGDGVVKDKKKAIHYYELAAIQGHSTSRYSLGFNEYNFGKYDRALKHWLISCRHGSVKSLEAMKTLFIEGHATKQDYEKALRSYQEYIKEIKSCQRDEAAAFSEEFKYILDS